VFGEAPADSDVKLAEGRLGRALRGGGEAPLRTHPAELGHCQQGDRAQRFQRLHLLGGGHGKNLYLLDVLRRRLEYPELKRAVREQYERLRPSVVLIEDKASGTQLIQELIREGLYALTRYQPQSDKIMRMHAQTAMIENGFVHLPDTAPWLAQYLHELTSFPKGRHDDQVDSTAQMLDWFKRGSGPSSNAGIFELYRMRAEEARGQQARREQRVRLRVPQGIGHRNLLLLNVAADGTVEMLEGEAESFLRAGWARVD
jgi:predicted phage terminase large subunit-like protein